MEQLIKITSVPMRTMSYTRSARLVTSDSVDLERRKAIARQMSFHRSAGKYTMPVNDINKINRTFSRRSMPAEAEGENITQKQAAYHQTQPPVSQAPTNISVMSPTVSADTVSAEAVAAPVMQSQSSISNEYRYSSAVERGSLEMKVAKGDLTFLPPMVMTIVTQSPELHFEYLGDFNYVPPRDPVHGGNINLFT